MNPCRVGLARLADWQRAEGVFTAMASLDAKAFSAAWPTDAGFIDSWILACLAEVPDAAARSIQTRLADGVFKQRSPLWSWNYWRPGSRSRQRLPYPDDLDDTACALIGLTRMGATKVDGLALGALARLLTSVETAPGGPYRTWLVSAAQAPNMQSTDVAVNANIACLLKLHGVQLAGLDTYLRAAIRDGAYTSPFYDGTAPVLYFLARAYSGSAPLELQAAITAAVQVELARPDGRLSVAALLASAGCRAGIEAVPLAKLRRQLAAALTRPARAEAVYCDPAVDGRPCFAGAAALTTALILEALSLRSDAVINAPAKRPPAPRAYTACHRLGGLIQEPTLRLAYRRQLRVLRRHDPAGQVMAIAQQTARAARVPLDPVVVSLLDQASTFGWLAYTIYDDVLDGSGDARLLGVAHFAVRRMLACFQAAEPDCPGLHGLVDQALQRIDDANGWELAHARARPTSDGLSLNRLPNYGQYDQLAGRSWGHVLAVSAVLLAQHDNGPAALAPLHRFFHHYLIARQLHDDAHDWEADLRSGHVSSVVTALLAGYAPGRQRIAWSELPLLRQHFWLHTSDGVSRLIDQHIHSARRALAACPAVGNPAMFVGWLDALAAGAAQARRGRRQALAFMNGYGGVTEQPPTGPADSGAPAGRLAARADFQSD